jgi:hypothetical protein
MSYRIKYILTAALTAFVTSNCATLSQESKLLPNYESETGLKFPQSIIDLACLANTFPSQFKQKQNENNICFSQVLTNYTEIKHVNQLVYDEIDQSFISNTYPSLGIKGFHFKVFEKNEEKNKYVFIVIRHQEHDSVLTDEMNEMMSLFGPAATVDRQQGNKETFGASAVSSMIRFLRQQLGLDYLPQAISMFNKIQLHYSGKDNNVKYVFSGFSAGGLYAIILALYYNCPAITFSATGVEDIVKIYYSNLFTDKSQIPPIFNFAHELDQTPQLDCQFGTLCLYQSEQWEKREKYTEKELESIHLNTIFGEDEPDIIKWFRQPERWKCTAADNYNLKYGSCKRERSRWKDRIKSNSLEEQTIKEDL